MEILDKSSLLWTYLTPELRDLILDGEKILSILAGPSFDKNSISDYSFMVFPFAKAYEGFIKKFLLDMKLIQLEDYYSDDIRIGRILNPRFIKEEGNIFSKICDKTPEGLNISTKLWDVWKQGRNQVFHYFPHNFRKLDYDEALALVKDLSFVMEAALNHCRI